MRCRVHRSASVHCRSGGLRRLFCRGAGRLAPALLLLLIWASAVPAGEAPADAPASGETASATAEETTKAEAPPPEPTALDRWLKGVDDGTKDGARILGYSPQRLGLAAVILVLAFVLNTVLRFLLDRRKRAAEAKETERRAAEEKDSPPDSAAGDAAQPPARPVLSLLIENAVLPLRIFVWAIAFRLLLPTLLVGPATTQWVAQLLFSISAAVFIYQMVNIVEYYFQRYADRTDTAVDDALVPVVRKSLRVLVVIVAGLHIYSSAANQDISTLLAGLGIGGLAFALAAQDTLKNLFGFAMILTDQPFIVGERINFGGHDGVVEGMGFRSVKLRRLDGHQVVIPNAAAANEVIHNIGRRPYIRRVFSITITYDTPLEKVEKAVEIIRDILKDHEGMDPEFPPRVYFDEFNAASLNILCIYWYHPPAYWDYLAFTQRVNLEIMRRYEAEGIEFAFPTQTLYLAGDPNRELVLQQGLGRGASDSPPER